GAQSQSFSVTPVYTSVIEGRTTSLNCSVQNKAGDLQWTKDGFGLGASRSLPAYERYQMIGNALNGEYFLEIQNVDLSDDADYTCQVTATLGSRSIASAPAHLNVLLAPDNPVIVGYDNGTDVTVQPPATVVLVCRSENGKPAAALTWLQNDEALVYEVPEESVETAGKLEHAVSTLTLQPEKEDNGKEFKCISEHEALMGVQLFTTVTLSVQFAPDLPVITGYTEGTTIRSGEELVLNCIARGLTWWKDDELIDFSYSTDGNQAVNPLLLKIGYSDNNAKFTCMAENLITPVPLKTSITLTVHFTPSHVNITGYDHAVKAGDWVTLTCKSTNSNPPSFITWWTAGRQVKTSDDVVVKAPNGGYITSQNLTVELKAQTDSVLYTCQATNEELLQSVSNSVTLSVQYPPDQPLISGYSEGSIIKAGNLLRMTCVSVGGNPRADLVWLKNGQILEDVGNYATSGNIATNELSIIAEQADNGAEYACNASNAATYEPLMTSVELNVYFPPTGVSLRTEPETAREGERVVIVCTSSSSNPPSEITWFKDGVQDIGMDNGTIEGDNGGSSSVSFFILEEVSADDYGKHFLCRATNPKLGESANDAVTLGVQYAPLFHTQANQTIDSYETIGDFLLNISAIANPTTITYMWYRDGKPIDIDLSKTYSMADNGSLILHNVTRQEAGIYTCQASNAEGKRNLSLVLNVFFAPVIQISDELIVSIGHTSPLVCEAAANPKLDDFIHWAREGYVSSMYQQHYQDGKSTLILTNITKAHAGPYICNADNGIEPKASKVVQVIVQYAPSIDKSPSRVKVASTAGKTTYLICAAEGAPQVHFRWKKDSKEFNSTKPRHKVELYHKTYSVFYESRLTITEVDDKTDFGQYVCEAYNDLGTDVVKIMLERTGVPSAPGDLRVVTKADTSVVLTWVPGFNGGLLQSFHIRFNERGAKTYSYVDVFPPNATKFNVVSLRPDTMYDFNIRSSNSHGYGPYSTSLLTVTTMKGPETPVRRPQVLRVGEVPIYVIGIVVFVVALCLLLNLFLVICLIKKKRRKLALKARMHPDRSSIFSVIDYLPSFLQFLIMRRTTGQPKVIALG
uniref:Nephrin-like n=1 Tax=Saccoglossus kowalevskii TaxID=10224 RepID=A0ABM0MI06_SACKO